MGLSMAVGFRILSRKRVVAGEWVKRADDLYLRNAQKANAVAARLGAGLAALPDVRLVAPVEANLVFISLPAAAISRLAATGLQFARRGPESIRFVARFDSTEQEADEVIALVRDAITRS
jgi:threonine aldolase